MPKRSRHIAGKMLGTAIRYWRHQRHQTQRQLAMSADCTVSDIALLEVDRKIRDARTKVARIAVVLDIPFDDLVTGVNWKWYEAHAAPSPTKAPVAGAYGIMQADIEAVLHDALQHYLAVLKRNGAAPVTKKQKKTKQPRTAAQQAALRKAQRAAQQAAAARRARRDATVAA